MMTTTWPGFIVTTVSGVFGGFEVVFLKSSMRHVLRLTAYSVVFTEY